MTWWNESRKDWMHGSGRLARAPGQRHKDAPLSSQGRRIWVAVWVALGIAMVLIIVVGVLR
jgi:hypothetical protein